MYHYVVWVQIRTYVKTLPPVFSDSNWFDLFRYYFLCIPRSYFLVRGFISYSEERGSIFNEMPVLIYQSALYQRTVICLFSGHFLCIPRSYFLVRGFFSYSEERGSIFNETPVLIYQYALYQRTVICLFSGHFLCIPRSYFLVRGFFSYPEERGRIFNETPCLLTSLHCTKDSNLPIHGRGNVDCESSLFYEVFSKQCLKNHTNYL